jgi:hypothetical protein
MPAMFKCPQCGTENCEAGQDAGRGVSCVGCGKEVEMPREPGRKPFFSRLGVQLYLTLVLGMVLIDTIGVGLGQLLPAIQAAREAARRAECGNHLKQIALAMLDYRYVNGCFPPAFVADKKGKPMHSWRALLLPYMDTGVESLGALYKYDEPWDSPGNQRITDVPLQYYSCPSGADRLRPTTSYMMVVGPHTISDGPHSRKKTDITDDAARTIMLVEVADSDVRWAEPKDLRFDQLDFKIDGTKRGGLGSPHLKGMFVAFCDGHIEFINSTTSCERIKAMLTVDGGEKILGDDAY